MENTFKPITIGTQEELDAFMSDRINRLNAKHSEATAEFQSKLDELTNQLNAANKTIADNKEKYSAYDEKFASMESKIAKYESDSVKTRIAREEGIPFEMYGRINGSTEEEMREDARNLAKYITNPVAPLGSAEPKLTNGAGVTEVALDGWLKELRTN